MNSVRQTLYLKYRPQRFADLVGQQVVAQTLRNSVRDGRLSHAYLFTGIRGTGKTSAARILARAINCERPEAGEPCGECQPCLSISEQRSLDVIEIDAATNRGIDEIRDLRERAQFLPSQFTTKVYIIDEAHMLTPEAGNAFLKTLEEPPEHACFILATTEPQRLAETVLSRCLRFDFRRIPAEAMAAHLAWICAQEGVPATADALALVADAGGGSLRDAISLLDRLLALVDGELDRAAVQAGLGMADPHALARLAAELAMGQMGAAWAELHQLQAAGVEPRQLVRALGGLARDQLWRELSGSAGPSDGAQEQVVARPGFWLDLMAAAAAAGAELRRADDPWMSLEASLLRLCAPPADLAAPRPQPTPAVAARVQPSPEPPLPGLSGLVPVEPPPTPKSPPAEQDDDSPGPQPSQEEAPPTLPIEPPSAPAGAADGVARWPEILARLVPDNLPVLALLRSGRPASHRDGVLVVEFEPKFGFHVGQMQSPAYLEVLQRACREVLGEEVVVQVVKSSPAPKAEPEMAPLGPEAGAATGTALRQALNVFPGSRVTRLGSSDKR